MRTMSEIEARNTTAGYNVKCLHCGKERRGTSAIGVTYFYFAHKHYGWVLSYFLARMVTSGMVSKRYFKAMP